MWCEEECANWQRGAIIFFGGCSCMIAFYKMFSRNSNKDKPKRDDFCIIVLPPFEV